jgi:hypothetical protein
MGVREGLPEHGEEREGEDDVAQTVRPNNEYA